MKYPYINAVLRMFRSEPKEAKHGWERYGQIALKDAGDPSGPPTREGSMFCCHGSGLAAHEKIVTCSYPGTRSAIDRKALAELKKNSPVPCGATWHTGCVTKHAMTSESRERSLMDSNGHLEVEIIPDPFACCKVWLKDVATIRSSRGKVSPDIETASGRRHRQRIAKLKAQGFNL
jgi:hypothetical protein